MPHWRSYWRKTIKEDPRNCSPLIAENLGIQLQTSSASPTRGLDFSKTLEGVVTRIHLILGSCFRGNDDVAGFLVIAAGQNFRVCIEKVF